MQRVTRHFVTLPSGRQVHYRRTGRGPPVLLLHQSPSSSHENVPLMRTLAEKGFTVVAPDTPGNGLSEGLPANQNPSMQDFADGVVEFMSALGIDAAPIYGYHTGGVCALAVGTRYPERVTVAIMDGYIQLTEEERRDFLANYLPPLALSWSGSHLTWAWARMREQVIFFPWYSIRDSDRMSVDMVPTPLIHEWVMNLFRAGDDYRKAYRSAFTFDTEAAVRQIRAEAVIMTSATDLLTPYFTRMPVCPANVRAVQPLDSNAATVEVISAVSTRPASRDCPPSVPTGPLPDRLWSDFLPIEGGFAFCRRNTQGTGRPIVMIHDTAGSSHALDRCMTVLIGKRPLLAVDLPGHGDTDHAAVIAVQAQADFLARAIAGAGYSEVDVFAEGRGGSCVGIELALRHPKLVAHVALEVAPEPVDAITLRKHLSQFSGLLELEPLGHHWIRVWNVLRDRELFDPWFQRLASNLRRNRGSRLAPAIVQQKTLDVFKCQQIFEHISRAHLEYDCAAGVSQLACDVGYIDTCIPLERWSSELLQLFDRSPAPYCQ